MAAHAHRGHAPPGCPPLGPSHSRARCGAAARLLRLGGPNGVWGQELQARSERPNCSLGEGGRLEVWVVRGTENVSVWVQPGAGCGGAQAAGPGGAGDHQRAQTGGPRVPTCKRARHIKAMLFKQVQRLTVEMPARPLTTVKREGQLGIGRLHL